MEKASNFRHHDVEVLDQDHLRLRKSSAVQVAETHAETDDQSPEHDHDVDNEQQPLKGIDRRSYTGALVRNGAANVLPALYIILSRIWLADLDPTYVALASVYFYIGGAAEIINEGIPKAGWNLIADQTRHTLRERYQLAVTLILIVAGLSALLMVALLIATPSFVGNYVPENVRSHSYTYIRLSAGSVFFSAFTNVLSLCTRALDEPDVPLLVQSVGFLVAIILDLLIISRFRVVQSTPNVNYQAANKLACDGMSALVGLLYFFIIAKRRNTTAAHSVSQAIQPSRTAFLKLIKVGWPFVVEVLPRQALNLWWSAELVGIGPAYAAAWGVYWTIRAGILFTPLLAIESACYTFVGHAWGQIANKRDSGHQVRWFDFKDMGRIILISSAMNVIIEVIFYIVFAFGPGQAFAFFFANDAEVADLVVQMWRRFGWGFLLLVTYFQASSLLIIAAPKWYLAQSLLVSVCFTFPVQLAGTLIGIDSDNRWLYLMLTTPVAYVISFLSYLSCSALWLNRQVRTGSGARA